MQRLKKLICGLGEDTQPLTMEALFQLHQMKHTERDHSR
jgi:hypothetical protein